MLKRRPRLVAAAGLAALVLVLALAYGAAGLGSSDRPRAGTGGFVANEPLPWLVTEGNRLVTEQGREPVLLRGANLLRSEWDGAMDAERRAVPALASDWGGNVFVRGFASDPVNVGDGSYLEMLDEHVALALEHDMYVVFAWRSKTVNGPQLPRPDDEAGDALTALAKRYHGVPNVLYALQVEPHDSSWEELQPLFTDMVDALRRAAAPHVPVVMVPGTRFGRDVSHAATDPVDRPNIVYKTHPYGPEANFAPQFLDAHDAGLPVFVGEFGLLPEQGMHQADVESLLEVTRERGIGWAAWALDFQGNPGLVLDNVGFEPAGAYGRAVREEMRQTPPLPRR